MPRKFPIEADPTAIGDIAAPPFARLPDPATLFARRAERFAALAAESGIGPFLSLLAGLARAQAEVVAALPPLAGPDEAALARAAQFDMPPLDRAAIAADPMLSETLGRVFAAAASETMPDAAARALRGAAADDTGRMIDNVLAHAIPPNEMAEHAFVAAGLQIHFARLAATLDPARLQRVADGVCPVCAGRPVASVIVGWLKAEGARFAACPLCATLWHVVRIKCLVCQSTAGIRYQEIEGGPGTVKAETCDSCHSYVKILHQNKDPALEPVADDVASLALDLLMHEGPYHRAAFNPFLLGY